MLLILDKKLDEKTFFEFHKIFDDVMHDDGEGAKKSDSDGLITKEISSKHSNARLIEIIMPVLNKAVDLIWNEKIQRARNYVLEFHLLTVDGKATHPFEMHIDSDGPAGKGHTTVIFYLDKTGITGGDLEYQETEKSAKKLKKVSEKDVVIMSDDLPHRITNMEGKGQRKAIVCFI